MPQKRLTFDDDAEDDDEDEPAGPDMAGVGSVVGSGRLVGVVDEVGDASLTKSKNVFEFLKTTELKKLATTFAD